MQCVSPPPALMRDLERFREAPAPQMLRAPSFQPKARHSSGVRRAVEGEELIPVPHVGKSSPLGVKLQSLME